MAYIGNQPSPSNVNSDGITDNSIKNADIAADAAIDVSKLNGVTATNTEINKLDGVTATTADLNIVAGADAAGVTASDLQKTQYLSNVTSDVQTQLTNAAGAAVKGTLTKSFAANETSTIALTAASTPTPIVSVTKEVPQVGVSAKGNWDVRSDGSNYEIEDSAPNVSITPSVADDDGNFTLGSGSFASTDVGKRIVGNGGEAVLKTTSGAYELVTAFNDTSTIAAGDWEMYGLDFNSGQGLKMAGFYDNAIQPGSASDTNVIRKAILPSSFYDICSIYLHDDGKTFTVFDKNFDEANKLVMDTAWDTSEISVYIDGNISTSGIAAGSDYYKASENHNGTRINFTSEFDDGTNTDQTNDNGAGVVYQYAMSEAHNLDTLGTEPVGYKDFSSTDNKIKDVKFSSDGTKYFLYGGETGYLYTINAATAGQINPTDVEDANKRLDLSGITAVGTGHMGFVFDPSGSHLYVFSRDTNTLNHFTLTTAFDISTATYSESNNSFSYITDMRINSDGTTIIWTHRYGIREATLGSAFSVDSSTTTLDTNEQDKRLYNTSTYQYANSDTYYGWHWSPDGQYLFVNSNREVYRYTASQPFNIKSLYRKWHSETNAHLSGWLDVYGTGTPFGTSFDSYRGIATSTDGTKLYLCSESNNSTIVEFILSTAWDLSTVTAGSSLATSDGTNYRYPHSLTSAEDSNGNSYLYFATRTGTNYGLTRVQFSTAWDLSTGSVGNKQLSGISGNELYPIYGIAINPSGSGFVAQSDLQNYQNQTAFGDTVGRFYNNPLVQFTMSTPFEVNVNQNQEVNMFTDDMNNKTNWNSGSTGANPFGFSTDGSSLFTGHYNENYLYEIKLEGPFSISQERLRRSAGSNPIGSYQSQSGAFDNYTRAMVWHPEGTYVIVLHSLSAGSASLKRYPVTTPWDITTIGNSDQSYVFETTSTYSFYKGLLIDPTGRYLTSFRKDNNSGGAWRYFELSSPWDLTNVSTSTRTTSLNASVGTSPSYYATSDNDERDAVNGYWFNHNGTVLSVYIRSSTSDDASQYNYVLNSAYRPAQEGASKVVAYGSSSPSVSSPSTDYYANLAIDRVRNKVYITSGRVSWNGQAVNYPGSAGNKWDDWDSSTRAMTIVGYWAANNYNAPAFPNGGDSEYRNFLYTPTSYAVDNELSSDGRYLYVLRNNGHLFRHSVAGEYLKDVTPHNQYFPAVTNNTGQVDTSPWTDINSMIATESGSGDKFYAFSTDARTTFKIVHTTDGTRNIVRNNSGTWQYNSNTTYGSETWTNATSNNQFAAFREAMGVSQNRMNNTQLVAVDDNDFFAAGDTFDLAIVLRSYEGQIGAPSSDGVSVNYDAAALNKGAILGTDYDYDVPSSTSVRITSLKAQNLKVKVL